MTSFFDTSLIEKINQFPDVGNAIIKNYLTLQIKFTDDFNLFVQFNDPTKPTNQHHAYTYLNYDCRDAVKYYYFDRMPHNNINDVYDEIKRMSNTETRQTCCKSRYYRTYI